MGNKVEGLAMNVCVYGLWHLGSVTAACLASRGHKVSGLDFDEKTIDGLSKGRAPLLEPGLNELLQSGIAQGNIKFTADPRLALKDVEVVWVTFDTPVDEEDRADVDFVGNKIKDIVNLLPENTLVIVSSQMPVGSVANLEAFVSEHFPDKDLIFASVPENLRLGQAIDVFLNPDRLVVGVRSLITKDRLDGFLRSITDKIEWMSVESAEMTKHAINAFLAMSICFANEVAAICEMVGGDAKEVERGLKTESRIGHRAYVSAGGAFAGGTLARDIEFLNLKSEHFKLVTPLFSAVRRSNDEHKKWIQKKIHQHCVNLDGIRVAVWGVTYKAGTNTLRRSSAIELCKWLLAQGASVSVYDPTLEYLPSYLLGDITRHESALDAVVAAKVLVVGTDWPELLEAAVDLERVADTGLVVIDPKRHLWSHLCSMDFCYEAVGKSSKINGVVGHE